MQKRICFIDTYPTKILHLRCQIHACNLAILSKSLLSHQDVSEIPIKNTQMKIHVKWNYEWCLKFINNNYCCIILKFQPNLVQHIGNCNAFKKLVHTKKYAFSLSLSFFSFLFFFFSFFF